MVFCNLVFVTCKRSHLHHASPKERTLHAWHYLNFSDDQPQSAGASSIIHQFLQDLTIRRTISSILMTCHAQVSNVFLLSS